MKLPIPDMFLDSVFELNPQNLKSMGIRLLLLDLDNTISPYREEAPQQKLTDWIRSFDGTDVEPYILSNNRGTRPEIFAKALNIGYVGHGGKPSPRAVLKLLEEKGLKRREAALAGDQIFTDVLCAKRAGILSIGVKPLELDNIFRKIRYGIETPFRRRSSKLGNEKDI